MAIYTKITGHTEPIKVSPVLIKNITPPPEPPVDDWVRPVDRPEIPTIGDSEQVFYQLFGVNENSPNDIAFTLTVPSGSYRVEWGDGTSNDYNTAVKAEHIYDYSQLSGTSGSEGYKWVWIKAYPLSGNLTVIDIAVPRHSLRPTISAAQVVPQVFEIYLRAENLASMPFLNTTAQNRHRHLNVFDFRGTNNIQSFSLFLRDSVNLRRLTLNTAAGTNFSSFMYGCAAFNQPLNIDTAAGTNFSYFMYNCYSFNQPLNIDTAAGTNFSSFMYNCYSFNQPMSVDLIAATTAIGANFFGASSYSLKSLRLLNMGSIHTALTLTNAPLDVDALVNLFNDLCDRTGLAAGVITITNCYGKARLTPDQLAIATQKNWTVA